MSIHKVANCHADGMYPILSKKVKSIAQLGKSVGILKVSNLETSAWQQRSIARSNSGV